MDMQKDFDYWRTNRLNSKIWTDLFALGLDHSYGLHLVELGEDNATSAAQSLYSAIESNNLEVVLRELHAIKGIAATLGLKAISKEAAETAQRIRREAVGDMTTECRSVFSTFASDCMHLRSWINGAQPSSLLDTGQDNGEDRTRMTSPDP